mmetsp:Transcript_72840/g.133395  ORF Transcript_72840/g.133395 Transcript_72840/m.133395 type:complete len:94 (-) Transcript_72840:286-567(-)
MPMIMAIMVITIEAIIDTKSMDTTVTKRMAVTAAASMDTRANLLMATTRKVTRDVRIPDAARLIMWVQHQSCLRAASRKMWARNPADQSCAAA